VNAALDTRVALLELDRQLVGGEQASPVPFGIGINTGMAVVGYLGFEDRFDYTAMGDTVNVAARLSGAASANEVLMGPQTYEAVRGHIQTRPVGPVQLKGRASPIMVHQALG